VSTAVVPQLLKRRSEGTKADLLVTAVQHSSWGCPVQAAPQRLRESLVCYSAVSACCRTTAASQADSLAFPFARPPISRLFSFTQVNMSLLIRPRSPYLLPAGGTTHAGVGRFRNEGK